MLIPVIEFFKKINKSNGSCDIAVLILQETIWLDRQTTYRCLIICYLTTTSSFLQDSVAGLDVSV